MSSPSIRLAVGLLLALCVSCGSPAREQARFSAGDEKVENPISMPAGVADLLGKDPFVRTTMEQQGVAADRFPFAWFQVSEVHLAGPDERDVVVVGYGPLLGANITTFWLYRPVKDGYELLLKPSAYLLHIKESRSHDYRDIEVSSATSTMTTISTLKYDGRRYRVEKALQHEN